MMDQTHGTLLTFVLAGALAQMIDGSLGMGYKTSTTTFLLSMGVPPVLASSSVHIAGITASGVSGLSHWRMGNFDCRLCRSLILPGILGAVVGALVLSYVDAEIIRPVIAFYLLVLGLRFLRKALKFKPNIYLQTHTTTLGLTGGFFDAVGGGGWGPIVTSTLVVNGHNPREVIGSVNIAEFFVTIIQAFTFVALLNSVEWTMVLGLMIGATAMAPFAAMATRLIPAQKLMLLVGLIIIVLSLRVVALTLF